MKRFARRHGLDLLIVIAAVAAVVEVLLRRDDPDASRTAPVIAALAALLLVLPLLARRRSPFLALTWLWLLAAALSFLDDRLVVSTTGIYVAGLVSAFLIGSLRDERQGRIGLVILAGSAAIVALNDPAHSLSEVVLIPATFALAWLGGLAQHERELQALEAEERARLAEREREVAARIAIAEERTRIARELHDIVAHAVSVMVLQVGAVRHKLPAAPPEDREALQRVEQTGRTALAEMRRLLGAMRDDGEDAARVPQRGLGDLDGLLDEVGRAGLPVQLHVEGEPHPLPDALDVSAYRIVQEGLTNALKHAHAGQAEVTVGYGADELRIEVRDDGGGATPNANGHGHGLVGVRERVKIYGGEMTAGPVRGGGFVLRTRLPLRGDGS